VEPSVSRRGTCDGGIWTKPLAFAADAEGYINIMVWGLNGRFAISSPSGHYPYRDLITAISLTPLCALDRLDQQPSVWCCRLFAPIDLPPMHRLPQ
jgi:hypothetical protein